MIRNVTVCAVFLSCVLGAPTFTPAAAVQPCPDSIACAQIAVDSARGTPGDTLQIGIRFQQGPNDDRSGGIDAIAALAMSVGLRGTGIEDSLALADCTADSSGLPNAVHPDPALAAFSVVIQNAYCTAGHLHCLCPDPLSGVTPDSFMNVAIFAPKASLPSTPVTIPALPNGRLFSVDLRIGQTASGSIPLHVFNSWTDAQHPFSTALVSIGDTLEVDQTCVPQTGVPPCGDPSAVSQLAITDGVITVTAPPTPTFTPTSTAMVTATTGGAATATATPTSSFTSTATASASTTATRTASATPTPSPSLTPTASFTTTATPVHTSTPSPTGTDTASPTASSSATPTRTASPTPSNSPTMSVATAPSATATPVPPTATPAPATPTSTPALTPSSTPGLLCVGDCNGDGTVTVDEIVTMLDIALGNITVSVCPVGDFDHNGQITVDEIVAAVGYALNGC